MKQMKRLPFRSRPCPEGRAEANAGGPIVGCCKGRDQGGPLIPTLPHLLVSTGKEGGTSGGGWGRPRSHPP